MPSCSQETGRSQTDNPRLPPQANSEAKACEEDRGPPKYKECELAVRKAPFLMWLQEKIPETLGYIKQCLSWMGLPESRHLDPLLHPSAVSAEDKTSTLSYFAKYAGRPRSHLANFLQGNIVLKGCRGGCPLQRECPVIPAGDDLPGHREARISHPLRHSLFKVTLNQCAHKSPGAQVSHPYIKSHERKQNKWQKPKRQQHPSQNYGVRTLLPSQDRHSLW